MVTFFRTNFCCDTLQTEQATLFTLQEFKITTLMSHNALINNSDCKD